MENETYEIAHIETVPYKDSSEFKIYRDTANSMNCIRTVEEWEQFFEKVELKTNGCRKLPASCNWKTLCDCIIGYKAGLWDIPYLNTPGLTVKEKCEWINSFNNSENVYGKNQWEKASEKTIQARVFPSEAIKETLDYMNSYVAKKEQQGEPESRISEPIHQDIPHEATEEAPADVMYEEPQKGSKSVTPKHIHKDATEKPVVFDRPVEQMDDGGNILPVSYDDIADNFYGRNDDFDSNIWSEDDLYDLPF